MYLCKRTITLLTFVLLCFPGISSDIIELKNEDEKVILGSYVDLLEDSLSELTIQQIISQEYSVQFRTNQKKYPYTLNENLNSTYWLRFNIRNLDTSSTTCIAQFNNPTLSYVELFYKDKFGNYRSSKAGDLLPFRIREYQYPRITFTIPLNEDTTVIYFKVKSDSPSGFSLSLYTTKSFYASTKTEYYLQGIYLGIIILMLLYNLMTFLAVRESVYLYFSIYVLSCALYTLNSTRIGFEYLWPDNALFNAYGSYLISSALILSFTFYAINILSLKKYYPVFAQLLIYLTLLIIVYNGFIDFVMTGTTFAHDLTFYLPFIPTYIVAFKVMRKGYKPALYFFIGLSFILLSILFTSFDRIDLFWPTAFSVYGLHFAFVVEMVIFSYALSERLRIIKEEKELALIDKNSMQTTLIEQYRQNELLKDKVNKELEERVSQRTIELQEKNKEMVLLYEKIKQQSEAINQWNIRLDLDNQKLSNDIKDITISRVLHKNVEFEDFNKIFPDDKSCYRFLEELKWGNGYKCSSCSNEKFFEGKTLFTRRCTRCGHEESLIYNTIFQGSKIPLSKQFYMLFLIYNSDGKITYTQLSEILSMRLKTCWAFSKKIKDKMKNHKWSELDGWDSIILLQD
jgi:two-component system, sensor histidine kinase LadS